jgi:hypothetical protein
MPGDDNREIIALLALIKDAVAELLHTSRELMLKVTDIA